jgi:cell shape-determining protein MreC
LTECSVGKDEYTQRRKATNLSLWRLLNLQSTVVAADGSNHGAVMDTYAVAQQDVDGVVHTVGVLGVHSACIFCGLAPLPGS